MDTRDIAKKLAFFSIKSEDTARFPGIGKAVARCAPKALDVLYGRIASTPETSGLFSSQSSMDSARAKQIDHWQALFAGSADASYFARAEKIGKVHARIGLSPQWYIGAYASVLEAMVVEMAGPLARGKSRKIATLVKMALLDMEIAVETYFAVEEERRSKVIDSVGAALRRMTDGDFSVPLEGLPPEFAAIQNDFETMRAQVGAALGDVAETSKAVDMGAQEIRQASDDLARRTEQQAASLEEASAAMSTLAASVGSTAGDAVHLRDSVQSAHGDAQAGGGVVDEAVQAMTDIHHSAQEIGKIIAVIDGIAFQTNLLALNAGVEAARAGDAGRGFAVVANEVRALAQRSAEAALDIKTLIGQSSVQVERGVALVGQTGDTFTKIVGKVGEIAGLASNIANAASSQATNIGHVRETVRELDVMTQQNAAMVEEATAASRNLAGEADRMAALVGRFALGNSAQSSQANMRYAA
ncbi:MAG: methyl-accepting chemotaxis protein [Novosphingobium sp.]